MMPLYNGSHLAEQEGVVVVAINYRLSAFSFSPVKLGGKVLANNGFKDQREAMRWVRQHIAAFGGDPGSITIFGASAGGFSTTTHVLSRGSSGLFQRAISESGDKLKTETLRDALNFTENLAKLVGCASAADITCLQQVDTAILTSAYDSLGSWQAVIDGDVYEDAPLALIKQGKFNHVPFINGNTENEGSVFLYPQLRSSATATEARCMLEHTFGTEAAKKIIQAYPLAEGIDNRPVLASAWLTSGTTSVHFLNLATSRVAARWLRKTTNLQLEFQRCGQVLLVVVMQAGLALVLTSKFSKSI